MAAKYRRTPFGLGMHEAVAAHVEANGKAHAWAEQCLAYRAAGNSAKAKAAGNKAKFWLRKALALEARAAHRKPAGGRAADEDQ